MTMENATRKVTCGPGSQYDNGEQLGDDEGSN